MIEENSLTQDAAEDRTNNAYTWAMAGRIGGDIPVLAGVALRWRQATCAGRASREVAASRQRGGRS